MRNYARCLRARKGATVAVAALVTLAVGLGARALAEDIELVSDGAVAASEGIVVVDDAQSAGEQPAPVELAPAKPLDGPQESGVPAWSDDAQKVTQKVDAKKGDKERQWEDGLEDSDTDGDGNPFPEPQWPWEMPPMPGSPGFSSFRTVRYLNERGEQATCQIGWQDISDESFEDYGGFRLDNGIYVVTKDRTFNERPNVLGDAKIILCDGATVNFKKGIRCETGKLTIYAQSTGGNKGRLIATGTDQGAGIGGGNEESNGSEIVICGGYVEATGSAYGAGIGGGDHGGCGTIRILGGEVKAQGGGVACCWPGAGGASGIGSGDAAKDGGSVEISSGTVNATGGDFGAGIGSGDESSPVNITINGGKVIAKGGDDAAGIGGGNEVGSGAINITGGDITATGGELGAGIGGGDDSGAAPMNISGATIYAVGGEGAAGIGSGEAGGDLITAERIWIKDCRVYARGGDGAAGIGGGYGSQCTGIEIYDSDVRAIGVAGGAGIGSGRGGCYGIGRQTNMGKCVISGGHVQALAKTNPAWFNVLELLCPCGPAIGAGGSGSFYFLEIGGGAKVEAHAADGPAVGSSWAWDGGQDSSWHGWINFYGDYLVHRLDKKYLATKGDIGNACRESRHVYIEPATGDIPDSGPEGKYSITDPFFATAPAKVVQESSYYAPAEEV